MHVAPRTVEVVTELLTPLRVQIETYALRLCLRRMTGDQLDGLHGTIEEMSLACRRKDEVAVIDNDFAFHRFLLTAAGLDEVVPVWKGVVAGMRDFHIGRNRTQPYYGVIPFVHERLLDVFRAGDVDEAVRALASHIEGGEINEQAVRAYYSSRR